MDNSTIVAKERDYVNRAIDTLKEIGLNNPSVKQIRKCIDGLKSGERFSTNWYLRQGEKN